MPAAQTVEERCAGETYAYLTTTGRVTGRPHAIEIWFGALGDTIYLLAGGGMRSDWVRNLQRTPEVRVRIGRSALRGRGRLVRAGSAEESIARALLFNKYQPGNGDDLRRWRRTALPVAIDVVRRAR